VKYFIQTYGCAMNSSDSERVASVLERLGYEKSATENEADMLVFNTCSVKQKAEDKVTGLRKSLARLHKQNSSLKIAVTGCMVRQSSTRPQRSEGPSKKEIDNILKVMPEMDIAF